MKQAWRMLWRDARSGELRVLALALVVAVASVTSVGFFGDRVGRALARDAHQILGADLVVVSDHPLEKRLSSVIEEQNTLQTASATAFISMAISGERSQLAGVKAVTENYPLRGKLRIADAPGAADRVAPPGPPRGKAWIEERLVSALHAPVGSRIRLGYAEFQVDAVLTLEPERSANFFNLAPRILINAADLPATGLIQNGSRASYYLYAAGEPAKISALEKSLRPMLGRGERLETLETGRPEVRAGIERAQRFLSLTALLAAILAGVAIALGTRRFVERHLDGCAVMRCLGATQAKLVSLYGMEFLFLGALACAVGALLGYAAQSAIGVALGNLVSSGLPVPGPLPALQGFLVGLALLLGFALPPLLQLKDVPAMRVMRREAGQPRGGALAAYAAGFAALSALLVWQAGDARLGAYVVGGFAAAALVFFILSWAAVRFFTSGVVLKNTKNRALRHGLSSLRRRAAANAVQVASLALGLTAVLLLSFTRNDLVDAWRRSAPADAPNRFLLGVQPEELSSLQNYFRQRGLKEPTFYPMVKGRVVSVNGKPVSETDYGDEHARRLIEREFNLSYMDELPSHNSISAGRWFSPGTREISVEEGIARTLGWRLGDELTFDVAGEKLPARITSLRKLRWDSMKVNFFVIAPPSLLSGMPASYISAFHLDPGEAGAMNELVSRFPNVTLVDIAAVVRQAQDVADRLIDAVQVVFLFALGAGLIVLYSALVATEDERRREAAIMRVYGASRSQVAASQRAEFLAMGLLSGVLAALGAAAIGQVLAQRVFDLNLPPSPALWISGPLAGLALLSLNAWLSSRKVLRASPAITLRESV